jgi:hypothetical protein
MKFFHTDVGLRQAGDVLEVTISSVANVRLMDTNNFNNYKNGMKHIYTGGLAHESPIRLTVPTFGHWHFQRAQSQCESVKYLNRRLEFSSTSMQCSYSFKLRIPLNSFRLSSQGCHRERHSAALESPN